MTSPDAKRSRLFCAEDELPIEDALPPEAHELAHRLATCTPFCKTQVAVGDTVVLKLLREDLRLVEVTADGATQTCQGLVQHADLVGRPLGSYVATKSGRVLLLPCTPELWSRVLPHRTQIIYQADAAMIQLQLELVPGRVVLEAGTGSGALSHVLARAVYPAGALITHDFHEARAERARAEFQAHGLQSLVQVVHRDVVANGFSVEHLPHGRATADAVMLDLPNPWQVIGGLALGGVLAPGGRICCFSPCVEQVSRSMDALREAGFADLTTMECLERKHTYFQAELTRSCVGAEEPEQLDALLAWRRRVQQATSATVERPPAQSRPKQNLKSYCGSASVTVSMPAQKQTGHTGYLTFATLRPRTATVARAHSAQGQSC